MSVDKTAALKRQDVSIDLLDANELNPNQMSDSEFNMLYDNMEKVGFVDAVFVRPTEGGRYRIIGGHHRVEVAKLLDYKAVPCTIIDDPDFDEDQEAFQVVRMNVIRGKMTPEKFARLYESLGSKYSHEVMRDAFGFSEEAEFTKLLKAVAKDMPPDMKATFKEASAEVKSVDDLTKLLNKLYGAYGDTLPYGYMLMDFGGKDSVWLRMSNQTKAALYEVGKLCVQEQRTMDDVIGGLVQLIAENKLDGVVAQLIASSKPVVIPKNTVELPTQDFLEQLKA